MTKTLRVPVEWFTPQHWTAELTPGARWAWLALCAFVHQNGRPAGETILRKPAEWSTLLGVAEGDIETALAAAARSGHARSRKGHGRGDRLYLPFIARQVSPSTIRMRRKRARDVGALPDLPAYTRRDALPIARLIPHGRSLRGAITQAIADALNAVAGVEADPVAWLTAVAQRYPAPVGMLTPNPIDYLDAALTQRIGAAHARGRLLSEF